MFYFCIGWDVGDTKSYTKDLQKCLMDTENVPDWSLKTVPSGLRAVDNCDVYVK